MSNSSNATYLDLSESGLITAQQAADLLGTTVSYIRRLTYTNVLHVFKFTGRFGLSYYRRAEVEAYRDSHPFLGNRSSRLG